MNWPNWPGENCDLGHFFADSDERGAEQVARLIGKEMRARSGPAFFPIFRWASSNGLRASIRARTKST